MTKSEQKDEERAQIRKQIDENIRMLQGLINRYFLTAYEAGYEKAKEDKELYE